MDPLPGSKEDNTGRRLRAMSAPMAAEGSSGGMSEEQEKDRGFSNVAHVSSGSGEQINLVMRPTSSLVTRASIPVGNSGEQRQNPPIEPTLPPLRHVLDDVDVPRGILSNQRTNPAPSTSTSHSTTINASGQDRTLSQAQDVHIRGQPDGYQQQEAAVGHQQATSRYPSHRSYVSPATFLGEEARAIARRQYVPYLQRPPSAVPPSNSSFQPRGHKMTQKILQKTAKCDFCNQRNTSVLLKCQECPTAICRACVENGKLDSSPRHGVKKEDRGLLDWDPNTGPRAAGFRTKRQIIDNNGTAPVPIDRGRISRQSSRALLATSSLHGGRPAGGDGTQDSDEDWSPSSPRRKSYRTQSKRQRGRPRKNPLPDEDDDEDELDEASTKRPRRDLGTTSVATGSGNSTQGTGIDEDTATATSYRPIRQTAMVALDRAYGNFHARNPQASASSQRNFEQRSDNIAELPSIHPQTREIGRAERNPERVSRSLAGEPASSSAESSASFTSAHYQNAPSQTNLRMGYDQPPIMQPQRDTRDPHIRLPPPIPLLPPAQPPRYREPGLVPRGTYPRPQYGSSIPGTWQPPLWTSNGVDWDRPPGNLGSATPGEQQMRANGYTSSPAAYTTTNRARAPYNGFSLRPSQEEGTALRGSGSHHEGESVQLPPLHPQQTRQPPPRIPSAPRPAHRQNPLSSAQSAPENTHSADDLNASNTLVELAGSSSNPAPGAATPSQSRTPDYIDKWTQTDEDFFWD